MLTYADHMLTNAGECNYLFRIMTDIYDLYEVPNTAWQTTDMQTWSIVVYLCVLILLYHYIFVCPLSIVISLVLVFSCRICRVALPWACVLEQVEVNLSFLCSFVEIAVRLCSECICSGELR